MAAYHFDEKSGTTAADASNSGNTGTVKNGTWVTGGKFAGALSFNGTSSLVSVADRSSLRLSTAMTLEAWIKPTTVSSWRSVLVKERPGGHSYALYASGSGSAGDRGSGEIATPAGYQSAVTTAKLPVSTWSFLSATYDGATLRVYVNGNQVSSRAASGAITSSTGTLRIGGNTIWGEYFKGLIDNVRIYNHVLSATAIKSDMTKAVSGSAATPPPAPLAANAGFAGVGNEGGPVSLSGSASGGAAPYSYSWNFGDGSSGTGQTPTHTYADNGSYTATLTVTDASGATSQSTTPVTVNNVAPTANAGGAYSGTAGAALAFTGAATDPGPVDVAAGFTYQWNFGDGSSATTTQTTTSHTYAAQGAYTVTLTVLDKDGASTSSTASATIAAANTGSGSGGSGDGSGTGNAGPGSVGLTAGWATFGQALPQGFASGGVQVGNLPTQTDVKNRWPDGSIRFAIVSAEAPAAGSYQLAPAPQNVGSFTPALPAASVQFNIGGTLYTAALPTTTTTDVWLSGPQVVERRYVVAPSSSGTPHAFLRVYFDVRSYNDGATRLDVTVENTLDIAAARNVSYVVDVIANGQNIYHHTQLTHYYLTRWRKTFDIGLTEAQVTPDFSLFQQAKALPKYMNLVPNTVNSTSGANFDILKIADLTNPMAAPGGRAEIAPYPDWVATYVAHGNAAQKDYVLANGDLAGSWPLHLRQSDGSFVSIDQRPNFILTSDSRAANYDFEVPAGNMSNLGPYEPETAHTPSLAYVPYVLTGDRYYAEEMGFWAAWGVASAWPQYRNYSEGLIYPAQQQRSLAWQLRNMVDAAAYLPDTHPAKAYFTSKVMNNLNWADAYALERPRPLGAIFDEPESSGQDSIAQNAPWQDGYLSWSLRHAQEQGFQAGQAARDTLARFILNLFTSAPAYPIDFAYGFWLQTGTVNANGSINHFTTMQQLYNANFPSGELPACYDYSPQLRFSLQDAIDRGFAGAQGAFNYNEAIAADWLPAGAGWAIDFD